MQKTVDIREKPTGLGMDSDSGKRRNLKSKRKFGQTQYT